MTRQRTLRVVKRVVVEYVYDFDPDDAVANREEAIETAQDLGEHQATEVRTVSETWRQERVR